MRRRSRAPAGGSMSDDARWAGRNADKDALRNDVWRTLERTAVNVGPVWSRIPNFAGADLAAWHLSQPAGMDGGAGGEVQSRSAADPGAAARAPRRQDRLRAGAGADQGLSVRPPRPGAAQGEGCRVRDGGHGAGLSRPRRAGRVRGDGVPRFRRRRLRRRHPRRRANREGRRLRRSRTRHLPRTRQDRAGHADRHDGPLEPGGR